MKPTQTQEIITRRVKVNRNRTPQEALDATGRQQHTDRNVVATMPRGEGEEVDVYFFQVGRYASPQEVEREFKARGLKPDPYAQAQVNAEDPAFADERPNGTQWDVTDGQSSFVAFRRWGDERSVFVNRNDHDWNGYWWFGGVRKEATGSDYIHEDRDPEDCPKCGAKDTMGLLCSTCDLEEAHRWFEEEGSHYIDLPPKEFGQT